MLAVMLAVSGMVAVLGILLTAIYLIASHSPSKDWTLVVVESPYAPKVPNDCSLTCSLDGWTCDWHVALYENERYARAAMKDCLNRGEAPYASHLLYTQPGVLDDTKPDEREKGIKAGFAWRHAAAKTVVYTDLGISKGMRYGIENAQNRGCPVEYRQLGPGWEDLLK